MRTFLIYPAILATLLLTWDHPLHADEPPAPREIIYSADSGKWSDPETWANTHVPESGDRVVIRSGHEILYDVASAEIIRGICISGLLRFSRDRDTLLNVGLIRIEAGNDYVEGGFDCEHVPEIAPGHASTGHEHGEHAGNSGTGPALEIGTPINPIPAEHHATIRLHAVEGMDSETCPAIVCCGGRMDIHGAPMNRTWVKMTRTADAGADRLFLATPVEGWNVGDRLLITGTARQEFPAGTATPHVTDRPASEVRHLKAIHTRGTDVPPRFNTRFEIELDEPLDRSHTGGEEFSAEVANLSRNVVIESAEPQGVRGHTMYHAGSEGAISYAEFRHLGKRGVLGKYPIHFHLAGDSMRGSSVIGASVWDSHNRWITIHGTQYLVVRDCVGYQSIGHGFFLEDGTEVYNVLDRNLAVQALVGEPLPEQVLPFDQNDGAGFWWANSLNAFTRNVAVECDQYGFRFEAVKTENFDPVLPILQPDGSTKRIDIRTLPFIRFDNNEAHCQRRFGLNLGGIRGLTYSGIEADGNSASELETSVGGTVEGIGPDSRHPFRIRDFKVWDTHWAFHAGSPCVSVEGMNIYDCNYGIWRSIIDRHQYTDLAFRKIHQHAIFFPTGGGGPEMEYQNGQLTFPNLDPVDDLPPATIITHVTPTSHGEWRVRGTTIDNGKVEQVLINGKPARPTRANFAQWEVLLRELPSHGTISAVAEDTAGNREPRPHVVTINDQPDLGFGTTVGKSVDYPAMSKQ